MLLVILFVNYLTLAVFSANTQTSDVIKFKAFISKYNRTYTNVHDLSSRFSIFQESLRRHERLNAARQNSYDAWYGVNQFSDLTPQEFQDQHLSKLSFSSTPRAANIQPNVYEFSRVDTNRPSTLNLTAIPAKKFDWAFSVVETAASVLSIRDKSTPVPLSAQELVDCALGNNGCKGGDTCRALHWLVSEDIALLPEPQYPFKGVTQECQKYPLPHTGVKVKTYTCLSFKGAEQYMIMQLIGNGPLAVAVDATMWHDYMGGIIQYHCETAVNHAVQIVGYDLTGPVPYFIVRNQWGKDWGLDGYLHVKIGQNVCGKCSKVAVHTNV